MSTLAKYANEQSLLIHAIQPQKGLKYACIIDDKGNEVLSFNEEYLDMSKIKKKKLFIETALQSKMTQEFDEDLGDAKCNVVERKENIKCVSVPLSSKHTALAMIKKNQDHSFFVNNAIATKQTLEKK